MDRKGKGGMGMAEYDGVAGDYYWPSWEEIKLAESTEEYRYRFEYFHKRRLVFYDRYQNHMTIRQLALKYGVCGNWARCMSEQYPRKLGSILRKHKKELKREAEARARRQMKSITEDIWILCKQYALIKLIKRTDFDTMETISMIDTVL